MKNQKVVTVKQFMSFVEIWDEDRVRAFAGDKKEWTALDVLRAPGASSGDKLWAVLREEFIEAAMLHEFACRCAERALNRVDNPDPRSVNAIAVKRRWIVGEATDAELAAARTAAWAAGAAWAAARDAARDVARDVARAALGVARGAAWDARDAAWYAAWYAARDAAEAASGTASGTAAWAAAWDAARDAEWDAQVAMLIGMLDGEGT